MRLVADEARVVAEVRPARDLRAEVRRHVDPLTVVVAVRDQAVTVHISQGRVVADVARTAAHAHVVLLREGVVLVQLAVPVGVGEARRIRVVRRLAPIFAVSGFEQAARARAARSLEVQHSLHRLVREHAARVRVARRVVEVHREGVGVHLTGQDDRAREAEVVVVRDPRLAVLAALGRDQDHAEGGARTVDRGRGRVLQHRDVVHVLRVQGVDVALHAVDQDQRSVRGTGTDGTVTTDPDRHVGVDITGRMGQLQTGEHTLQGARDVHDRTGLDVLGRRNGHGTRQVHLLLRAETHHDHILEHRGVLTEDHVVGSAGSRDCNFLGEVADALEDQRAAGRERQRPLAVRIGGGSVGRALLEDAHADHRFTIRVGDRAGRAHPGLGGRKLRNKEAYRHQGSCQQFGMIFKHNHWLKRLVWIVYSWSICGSIHNNSVILLDNQVLITNLRHILRRS